MAGLEIKLRGGIYYAFGTVAGQRVRKSLGTRSKRQAEELCAQFEARLWKRDTYGDEAVRTFEEAALSYLEASGEARFVPPLLKHFKGRVLGTIKPEEIRAAARKLYPERKGSTWNRNVLTPARSIINHAAGLGWCQPIKVKAFPTQKVQRRSVDRTWIDAFLAECERSDLPHLAACVLFMWQTGARVSEAVRVHPEHINLQDRIVLLETTKTDEWAVCDITAELMVRLANLPKAEATTIFGYASRFGVNRRMKAVCRRAKIDFVSPHQAGRHSYATNALVMGATIKDVMDGGRWKSARLVLETYAHSDRGGKRIAERFDAELAQSTAPIAQATERKG